MKRLRFILSDGRATLMSPRARRFARGDVVFVNGTTQQWGRVIRVRDSQYTVRLIASNVRCYVMAEDLREFASAS